MHINIDFDSVGNLTVEKTYTVLHDSTKKFEFPLIPRLTAHFYATSTC